MDKGFGIRGLAEAFFGVDSVEKLEEAPCRLLSRLPIRNQICPSIATSFGKFRNKKRFWASCFAGAISGNFHDVIVLLVSPQEIILAAAEAGKGIPAAAARHSRGMTTGRLP